MDIILKIDQLDISFKKYLISDRTIADLIAMNALIETSSWVEQRMDTIAMQFHTSISDVDNFGRIKKNGVINRKTVNRILKNSHSIDFEKNFKDKLILPLFGMLMIDKMEKKIASDLAILVIELENIKKRRNLFTHSYNVLGSGSNPIPSPSDTKKSALIVRDKLNILENELQKMLQCANAY